MPRRVDSALSKLLLDTGSVDERALEEAVQQQAIHAGALDTILLEMALLEERLLAELLAEAHDTAALAPERLENPDLAAVRALPERMAVAMRLCPLFLDELGLHVASVAPIDRALLDELAVMLDRPIVAHAVLEVRLHQALGAAYGTPIDERFAALLAELRVPTQERPPSARDTVDAAATWDLVEALAHLAAADSRDGIAKVACAFARKYLPFAAMIGLRGSQVIGWHRSGPAEGAQFSNRPFSIPDDSVLFHALQATGPSLGKPALSPGNAALFGWLGRRRPRSVLIVPVAIEQRVIAALLADGGIRARDYSQLADLVAFSARLGPAFEAVVRHRKSSLTPQKADEPTEIVPAPPPLPKSAPAAAALEEQTAKMPVIAATIAATIDETTGEGAIDAPAAAPSAASLAAPLAASSIATAPRPITMTAMPAAQLRATGVERSPDGSSPFARDYLPQRAALPESPARPPAPTVLESLESQVLESLASPHNAERRRPGAATAPPPAAGADGFAEVTDSHAADAWRGALHETVARGHQGGSRAKDEAARLFHDENGWEEIRYEDAFSPATATAPLMAAPATERLVVETLDRIAPGPEEQQLDVIDAEPPSPTELLIDSLEALDQSTVEYAQRQLRRLGSDVVPALAQRFPGRLCVDPFDPGANVRRASELSPLIELLERLGAVGLPAAIPHLDSRYPAHRFAAVLLFARNPDELGIDLLRARLHDTEPRIRALATEALVPFIAHPRFDAVLSHLRERLNSTLLEARRRAVQLLGAFRDVGAVPLLIATLEGRESDQLAEDVRDALRVITLQDLGVRARAWARWWARARKKSRVDWLVEGLDSEDRELRSIAALELAALAGDDFGYRPDADKRLRQRGSLAFSSWWLNEQRRYGDPDSSSPTASTGSIKSPD